MPTFLSQDQMTLAGEAHRQNTTAEIARLHAQLTESQLRNRHLAVQYQELITRWNETSESHGFRLLQRLYSLRASCFPRGSHRERLWCAVVKSLSSLCHAIERGCRGERNAEPFIEDVTHVSCSLPAPPETRDGVDEWTASDSLLDETDASGKKIWLQPIPYSPMAWKARPRHPSSNGSINLVILSLLPRSGSTMLQRICNARRKTLIWGEHNGILAHFAAIYKGAAGFSIAGSRQRDEYFSRDENPNTWIANMSPTLAAIEQAVVDSARALLNGMYAREDSAHDLRGFKEVRYGRAEAELLRKCYPDLKMLLLVRHPNDTWNSTPRDWYPSLDEWSELWRQTACDFMSLAALDANCYLLRYEDIVRREAFAVRPLTEFAEVTDEQIEAVLACRIGSNPLGIRDRERQVIRDHCREAMELFGYE